MVVCQGDCKYFTKYRGLEALYYCKTYDEDIEDLDFTFRCPRHTPKKRREQ